MDQSYPWLFAYAHVAPPMSTVPARFSERQPAPTLGEDEPLHRYDLRTRPPATYEGRRAPRSRSGSAPLDIINEASDGGGRPEITSRQAYPARAQSTDVRRSFGAVATRRRISRIVFQSSSFLTRLHRQSMKLFQLSEPLSTEECQTLWNMRRAFESAMSDDHPRLYEEDQLSPWRDYVFPLLRRLGISSGEHCLTAAGRDHAAALRPILARANMSVDMPSDLECVVHSDAHDLIAWLQEIKRRDVGDSPLAAIDRFLAPADSKIVVSIRPAAGTEGADTDVQIVWESGVEDQRPTSIPPDVKANAEKILYQLAGQILSNEARRVVCATWENMIVCELASVDPTGEQLVIGVSPRVHRNAGAQNQEVLSANRGHLISGREGATWIDDEGDSPMRVLQATFLSTLLALTLSPCKASSSRSMFNARQSGSGACRAGSGRTSTASSMSSALDHQAGLSARASSDGGASVTSGRRQGNVLDRAEHLSGADSASQTRSSLERTSSQAALSEGAIEHVPAGTPILLPGHQVHLDPEGLWWEELDIADNWKPKQTRGLWMGSKPCPTSLLADRTIIAFEAEGHSVGSGRLGDVLVGKAFFAATGSPSGSSTRAASRPHGSPSRTKKRTAAARRSLDGTKSDHTECVMKMVVPQLPRPAGNYSASSPDYILDGLLAEANTYLRLARDQQGKTIPKCYGIFRAQVQLDPWGAEGSCLHAPPSGFPGDYYMYGLVLERLGEPIEVPVETVAPPISQVDITDILRLFDQFHSTGLVHGDVSQSHILRVRAPSPRSSPSISPKSKRTKRGGGKKLRMPDTPAAHLYRICDLETCRPPDIRYSAASERREVERILSLSTAA